MRLRFVYINNFKIFFFSFLFFINKFSSSSILDYQGYKIIRIFNQSLLPLHNLPPSLDLLDHQRVLVKPWQQAEVSKWLAENHFNYKVLYSNNKRPIHPFPAKRLKRSLKEEKDETKNKINTKFEENLQKNFSSFDFDQEVEDDPKRNYSEILEKPMVLLWSNQIYKRYLTLLELEKWIKTAEEISLGIIKVKKFGLTNSTLPLYVVRMGISNSNISKPILYMDGGIHAREWVSVSAVLGFVERMVIGYLERKEEVINLMTNFTFFIVPLLNPDGYNFSHQPFGDRLWRKNLRKISSHCVGVDLNRNFGPQDNCKYPALAFPSACSNVFPGENPFSESETRSLRDLLERYKGRVKGYLNLHTYGNSILTPFGFTTNKSQDFYFLTLFGEKIGEKIYKKFQQVFMSGPTSILTGRKCGLSIDWAHIDLGSKYSFALELSSPEENFRLFEVPMASVERIIKTFYFFVHNLVQFIYQFDAEYLEDGAEEGQRSNEEKEMERSNQIRDLEDLKSLENSIESEKENLKI